MLNRKLFEQLLDEMDCAEMAQHSRLNHHVDGMDYLCLHRSDRLTVKLYLMEQPRNPHSGFLVHPHSHRYAFGSVVLHGELEHIRFTAGGKGRRWREYAYFPEHRETDFVATRALDAQVECHKAGSTYWVDPHEIHTLRFEEGGGPVLIGLAQFADVTGTSRLFLPSDELVVSGQRIPDITETAKLNQRCADLLGLM